MLFHGVTRLNSTTQTQGVAPQLPSPLSDSQRKPNAPLVVSPQQPISAQACRAWSHCSPFMPSACACSSLMSCRRSTRTAVISSRMRGGPARHMDAGLPRAAVVGAVVAFPVNHPFFTWCLRDQGACPGLSHPQAVSGLSIWTARGEAVTSHRR